MKIIELYQSGPNKHRWRLVAANGNNSLNPGENYKRRGTMCTQIVRNLRLPYSGSDVKDGVILKGYDANGRFVNLYRVRVVAAPVKSARRTGIASKIK